VGQAPITDAGLAAGLSVLAAALQRAHPGRTFEFSDERAPHALDSGPSTAEADRRPLAA
jgi:hypothetical protein